MGFYTRELERKRKLDADRAKFTVGDAPFRGAAGAPVTIIEFSDFECPHCAHALPTVERVLKEYEGRVRVAHKCFAFPQHKSAPMGCAAARAAAQQGKYWQMHDWIFAHQEEIASLAGSDFGPAALAVGLDWNRFKADYARYKADTAFNERITKEGEAWGVQGTPAFFINGELLDGARPFEQFKEKIDTALLERECAAPAPARPPAPASAPKPARRKP
jgi:protein-disulfide isomerase